MNKELENILDQVIEGFKEAIEREPATVEELDELIPDIPDLSDKEPEPTMPKWEAAQLRILDVINNTLSRTAPISLETAATLKTLAEARELIIRYPR
jgi:hypothetical protein